MGTLKEQMLQEEEQKARQWRFQKIADHLGLSYEEVVQLEPDIEPTMTSDDAQVGWDITFPQDTPKEILDRIGGDFHRVGLPFFQDGSEDAYDDKETEGGFISLSSDFAKRTADQLRKDADENK